MKTHRAVNYTLLSEDSYILQKAFYKAKIHFKNEQYHHEVKNVNVQIQSSLLSLSFTVTFTSTQAVCKFSQIETFGSGSRTLAAKVFNCNAKKGPWVWRPAYPIAIHPAEISLFFFKKL